MNEYISDMLNKGLVSFEKQGFVLRGKARQVFDLIKLATFTEFLVGQTLTRQQFYELFIRLENARN